MLQIDNLTKKFGAFEAVRDVSFGVSEGEVFALLGPNGSGKTTTLKCISGLTIPNAGRVRICGIEAGAGSTRARELISYLPQRAAFPENLTAREVARFYARLRNVPKEKADAALAQAHIEGSEDKPVGDFSGGMLQRLGLAVAALADAPVLLLDEPTANLDPHGVRRFREFILGQKEQRKTVLFSTHLLPEAEQLADRVGIFVGGRLVAQESIDNLRQAFRASGGSIEEMYLQYVGERDDER